MQTDLKIQPSSISGSSDKEIQNLQQIIFEQKQIIRSMKSKKTSEIQKHYKLNIIHTDNQFDQQQNFTINQENENSMMSAECIPLQENLTGYQITREAFNDIEIMQAFKIIDINQDSYITKEDITFFLEYLQQSYNEQQIQEMISMLSKTNKVSLKEFQKIGKGILIPLADLKVPENKQNQKKILQNINQTKLKNIDPSIVIKAQQKQIISFNKFQQSKNKKEKIINYEESDGESQFKKLQIDIKLRTLDQMKIRSEQFRNILTINIEEIIKKYHIIQEQYLTIENISSLLEITKQQALLLYGKKQVALKYVVIEAIAHSYLNKLRKLQLCLKIINNKSNIKLRQILFILEALSGIDHNDTIKKKLIIILKDNNYTSKDNINKYQMLQLITEYSHIIM